MHKAHHTCSPLALRCADFHWLRQADVCVKETASISCLRGQGCAWAASTHSSGGSQGLVVGPETSNHRGLHMLLRAGFRKGLILMNPAALERPDLRCGLHGSL